MNQVSYTPREIVAELDRFIIGQEKAKKSVAIALRNRWRRQQLDPMMREEILPKNILMVGPTGVGKTEIARRLAKLAQAPFIKVEATKYTEVGYVGRDVEQIIRDLLDIAINQTRERLRTYVKTKAESQMEKRIVQAFVGTKASEETHKKFLDLLRTGDLDDKEIEVEIAESSSSSMPTLDIPGMPGAQLGMLNLGDIFGKALGPKLKKKKLKVSDARNILLTEESDKLLDQETIVKEAIQSVEENGIVFLDEVDKITVRSGGRQEGGVSREGVQRDLLPLLEGTTVSTKHGTVKTDHILFIASGAFHIAKPSDLLPELQGRLPIRVELESLGEEEFVRILTEPEANLTQQYTQLLATENVTLEFTKEGIQKIAKLSADVNEQVENIGARRLHTIMEKLLEDISFYASDRSGSTLTIDSAYAESNVGSLIHGSDLSKFIL